MRTPPTRGVAQARKDAWAAYEVAEGEWRQALVRQRVDPSRQALSDLFLATAAMYRARIAVEDVVGRKGRS